MNLAIEPTGFVALSSDMAALAVWLFLMGTLTCIWAMQEIGSRITSRRTIELVACIGLILLLSAPVVGIYSHTLSQQESNDAPDSL